MYIYAVIIIHNGRFRFLPSISSLKRKSELGIYPSIKTMFGDYRTDNVCVVCWSANRESSTLTLLLHRSLTRMHFGLTNTFHALMADAKSAILSHHL